MILLALTLLAQQSCTPCHTSQAKTHVRTLMAQTLERGASARILERHPRLQLTLGNFRYSIEDRRYRVSDGSQTIDAPIRWAIGQGEAGQTYILELDGHLYESRVSFYEDAKGLAPTMGAPTGEPKNINEAIGRELAPKAVLECFGCHSATTSPLPAGVQRGTMAWTNTLLPGVQCVNCHTGSEKHASQVSVRPTSLSKLSTEELSEVCGKCHRTWADIAANGPRGVANVRFQPYRIARSKCYDAADRRIGCTACHDPHDRPNREAAIAASNRACAACHTKFCPTGRKDSCASCHMLKYELPGSHFKFTDHWIRVARTNQYPD